MNPTFTQLRSRLEDLLARPRSLKPQTKRQLALRQEDFAADLRSFLLCAAEVLEEYELDIIFAPQFTPSLDEQSEVSDLLYHWRPTPDQVAGLQQELCRSATHAVVILPDDSRAKLTLHEVMIERYVRLMRLEQAPPPAVMAALRESLANDLWKTAGALLRQRGFTDERRQWFARFVNHAAARQTICRGYLETAAQFVADQADLKHATLLESARAMARAAEGSAAYAEGGHAYWSPDVAQHHHYRGQGQVDKQLIEQRKAEARWLVQIEQDIAALGP